MAIDAGGNLFIADLGSHRIRKIDATTKIITTVAGNGVDGYAGDNGPAINAMLNRPSGVAVDAAGNLYIADTDNHCIRRVDAVNKTIRTIAGNGRAGYSGDDGPAINASLDFPLKVALDAGGNVYIADMRNGRIRKISGSTGRISTVAGTGEFGYSGDGHAATATDIGGPSAVFVDAAGNLFIGADGGVHRILRVDARTQIMTSVAGTGIFGFSGDGGPATNARLSGSEGIAFSPRGDLLISDSGNRRIRAVRGPLP